jgi:PAS domain S-box-containing protein
MITVLYVDDEPGLLEIGKLYLERTKEIKVETLNSATQGLDQLDLQSYDVIVSDFQMPHMDGLEFLKKVRSTKGDIPFILFTGRGREEVVIEAINNGADFYLQKGGEPRAQFAELAHKIRQLVRRTNVEGMLQQNENWFQTIIRYSDDIITLLNREGVIMYSSPQIEQKLGYKAVFMTGKRQLELAHPDDIESLKREFARSFEPGYTHPPVRYRIRKADGSYLHVESIITSLMDIPEMQGAIITTRDITSWVLEEDRLEGDMVLSQRAELMNRSGFWKLNTFSNDLTLSAGARALFGLPAGVCSLPDFWAIMLPEYREQLDRALELLMKCGDPGDIEYEIQRPVDGTIISIHTVAEYDPEQQVIFGAVYETTRNR